MSPAESEFEAALVAAHALSLEWLKGAGLRPAAAAASPRIPEISATGFDAAIECLRVELLEQFSDSIGPRYLGFVTGGVTPAALAGDWIASALDQNVSNDVGSAAAALERATASAFAQIFGLGQGLTGHFVSGATQSNLVALATAREWALHKLGHDAAEYGLAAAPQIRVLAGSAHSSISKALAILGMGRAALQPVARQPGRQAVDLGAMRDALARLKGRPSIVVASAGEVNTGEFDDVQALAGLCSEYGAWLHVDAAFGLFARLVPALAPQAAGVEHADSVTVDLHKWLNVPYDSALVYVRDPSLQRRVFRARSAYLGAGEDPLHHTPENSRRFRALPAWFTLMSYGREGIAAWVERNCACARLLASGIDSIPELHCLAPVHLNIVCFAPRAGTAEARDALLDALNASGDAFMTPTVLDGVPAIRAAFSNWRTRETDVARVLRALAQAVA